MLIEELIPDTNLESRTVEFKGIIEEGASASGKNKEINWLKTMVAFANTEGGRLYIGVDNKTHKILSFDHQTTDRLILMIHRQVRQRIEPSIDYEIIPISCPNTSPTRYILCVEVQLNKNLPVSLHEDGLLGIYVRNFGETELASAEQIRELVLLSDNLPYDQPITEHKYEPSKYSTLEKRMEEIGETLSEKELISIGFMDEKKRVAKGALLFQDDCQDARTKVSATVWPGVSKGSSIVLASEEYTGNLLQMIQNSIAFIRQRSANGFKKEAEGRSEYFAYPARSVTEGIVNAVGHRNYYIQGSQIEINLFIDRLEITSPGSLLGVRMLKKEKNIASIIPRRRNEVICGILEMCKYMEEKGSGFDKIEADYAGYGEEYQPYISADATSFTLTLPNLTYKGIVDADTVKMPEIYVDEVLDGKNDLHILSFCFGKDRSAGEIATEVKLVPSTYFRKTVLGRMVNRGLLIERKDGKTMKYRSNPEKVRLKD